MFGLISSSATSSLTVLFLFGIGLYLLDRRSWALAIYRWLYDFCHHDPMPADVVRGFLYNQPSQRKWKVAGIVATLLFIHTIWEFKIGPHLFAEVIVWLLGIPMTLFGIWVGYQIQERVLPNKSKIFETADQLSERLESVKFEDVSKGVQGAGQKLVGRFSGWWPTFWSAPKPQKTSAPVAPAPPQSPPQQEEAWREAIRRFTRGR